MIVDVIIPVWRVQQYLEQAIESALTQSSVTTTVIVIDDGNDEPLALVNYDKRVKLYRSNKNRGIGASRNLGISVATSPLVGFLDSDDIWPRDRCLQLIRAMSENDDYAYGKVRHFADDLAPTHLLVPPTDQLGQLAGSCLFRRSAFAGGVKFNEELRVGEFIDFMSQGRMAGWKGAQTNALTLLRRIHGQGHASSMEVEHGKGYLSAVRQHIDRQRT